jgi:aconitase A
MALDSTMTQFIKGDIQKWISQYVQVRDLKRALEEKQKAEVKVWQQLNKGKRQHYCAKRAAKKLNATPPWLTKEQLYSIELYYLAAKWIQSILEESIHVDHIMPLQGESSSGLHVPWNLQLLTANENLVKSNKIRS